MQEVLYLTTTGKVLLLAGTEISRPDVELFNIVSKLKLFSEILKSLQGTVPTTTLPRSFFHVSYTVYPCNIRQIQKRRRELKDDEDVIIWRQLSAASGLRRRLGRFHDVKIRFVTDLCMKQIMSQIYEICHRFKKRHRFMLLLKTI